MNWMMFIIACLATFRLALLFSKESGPAKVFAKLRRLPPAKSSAREGLSCPWCLSVWVSAAITTIVCALGYFPGIEWPLYWLAHSAGAVIINQQWTKG